ncbi:MAG: hypothetical protein EOM12_14910 [Verrucomicrobiae bacterium]|nr:hypothetical protein [Verrucomicrobiae bacterium]
MKKLYNTTISMGGQKTSRPIRTLVLAFVDPQNAANANLVTQLNRMASAGHDGNPDNKSATAYFATDVPSIMHAMRSIISTIRAHTGTLNAPLVAPARVSSEKDVFYIVEHTGRADSYWKGDLKKYDLVNGQEKLVWSTADELQKTDWEARKVYIPAITGVTATLENLAKLDTTLASALSPVIGINAQDGHTGDVLTEDVLTRNFIQWFLGYNMYDEIQRYKLMDIYLSGMSRVGAPDAGIETAAYRDFRIAHLARPRLMYTQSNAGLLHAFNDEDIFSEDGKTLLQKGGSERWAFMPPNALYKGRLRGLKGDWTSSSKWEYKTTVKAYSRHITDGPVVVEDVQIDGAFSTVLLGCMGSGGAGMYALDISDADKPRFLWAIENDIYSDYDGALKGTEGSGQDRIDLKQIRVWGKDKEDENIVSQDIYSHEMGSGQSVKPPAEWDYRDLRLTLSSPFVGFVEDENATREWVFLVGNGTPHEKNSGTTPTVYMSKIGTGEIITKFYPAQGEAQNAEFFISPVAVPYEGATRQIKRFFVIDNKGLGLFMGKISTKTPLLSSPFLTRVRTFPGGTGNIGTSFSLDLTKFGTDYWLFAANSDWMNLEKSEANTDGYFYAVNLMDMDTDISKKTLELLNTTKPLALNNDGWYLKFSGGEKLSSPPVVYNGYVFFSTFTKGSDPCNPDSGSAKLYAVRGQDGKGAWPGDAKHRTFVDMRISGVAFMQGKILLGATDFAAHTTLSMLAIPEAVANSQYATPPGLPGSKEMMPLYWKGR